MESKNLNKDSVPTNPSSKLFIGIFLGLVIVSAVSLTGMVLYSSSKLMSNPERPELYVTLYSSPLCGCCHQYIIYLEDLNVNVTHIKTNASELIMDEYKIPEDLRSCHITIIENYVVVGHVPIEAIDKLLNEVPTIDGISLPGMPSGAPGVAGDKNSAFDVIAFKDGGSVGIFISV